MERGLRMIFVAIFTLCAIALLPSSSAAGGIRDDERTVEMITTSGEKHSITVDEMGVKLEENQRFAKELAEGSSAKQESLDLDEVKEKDPLLYYYIQMANISVSILKKNELVEQQHTLLGFNQFESNSLVSLNDNVNEFTLVLHVGPSDATETSSMVKHFVADIKRKTNRRKPTLIIERLWTSDFDGNKIDEVTMTTQSSTGRDKYRFYYLAIGTVLIIIGVLATALILKEENKKKLKQEQTQANNTETKKDK